MRPIALWNAPRAFASIAFLLLAAVSMLPAQPAISLQEQKIAASIDAHNAVDQAFLQQIVDINSGTMHLAGVEAVKDVLVLKFEALGFQVHWVPMQALTARAGDLVAEHPCPQGPGKCGQRLLLIGYMDRGRAHNSTYRRV